MQQSKNADKTTKRIEKNQNSFVKMSILLIGAKKNWGDILADGFGDKNDENDAYIPY